MSPQQVLERIRKEIVESGRDTRYKPAAYLFVLNGLEYYLAKLGEKRHVTGQEFSHGLAEFACKQFGPMAHPVLSGWGVSKTDDFGAMVYNLIGMGLMSRRAEDSLEDFFDVFDLSAYFDNQDYFQVDKEYIRKTRRFRACSTMDT